MKREDSAFDLRLAPSAALVFASTALGYLHLSAALLVLRWLCGIGLLLALALLVARPANTQAPYARARLRGAGLVVGVAALSGSLSGAVADLRLDAAQHSPLAAAAAQSRFAQLDGHVVQRPRPVSGFTGQPMVVLVIDVDQARIAGQIIELDRPLLVFGPAESWGELIPGTRIGVAGAPKPPREAGEADAVLIVSDAPTVVRGPPVYQDLAAGARLGLSQAAHAGLDGDTAGLLVALTNGDTSGISDVTRIGFRDSGLAHLLAVSGANVAIVIGVLVWLLRRSGAPFAVQIAAAGTGLAAFVAITGPEPSVLRAAGMGVVMLIGLASGRPRSSIPALCAAIMVLVVAIPSLSASVGFVLSVVATAGIVVLTPWLLRRLERVPPWLALPLAVSTAAGLVTLPVIVLLYPVINTGSLIANVLAAPAVAPATVLGILATALGSWAPWPAAALCFVAGFFVRWIELLARVFSRTGARQITWPAGIVGGMLAALAVAAVLIAIARSRRGTHSRPLILATVAGLAALIFVRHIVRDSPTGDWIYAACDVGQGDAILARAGPQAAVLIDAGPDPVLLDDCLRELGVSEVPLVVLTHFHADHVAGISAVLGRRQVGQVAISGTEPRGAQAGITQLAQSYGVPVDLGYAGESWQVGAVRIEVLGPIEAVLGSESDANNNSLIARVSVGGLTMLTTGDAEIEEQQQMLDCGCLVADVLKVPHHGSGTQLAEFLVASQATHALISVGRGNDYGHPAASTMATLQQAGMQVHRTDNDGTILLALSGEDIVVSSYHGTRPDPS